MGRKYYKRYRGSRDKYSVEQTTIRGTLQPATTGVFDLVPATDLKGMRKVKHLTASLSVQSSVANMFWAIVYVPQGTTPSALNLLSGDLYEPNQYVMNCGLIDPDAGPIRVWTPLSRNLNSGDKISLLLLSTSTENVNVFGVVRYAITLQ